MDNTTAPAFGRNLTDAELDAFNGGDCTIKYTYDAHGRLVKVEYIGDCKDLVAH